MAFPANAGKMAALKRAAQKAKITEREEPGETEDHAESSQYEAGEEGSEPIGGEVDSKRASVGQITPRRPKRPF